MCKISRFMKSVTNTTNTKHTLTFLKSNYKYKRRVYTSMTHTHAMPRGNQPQRHAADAEAETEYRCANAKNTLNNAINQIINTKRIKCEIKLIFKLFILCVGQLLTHTTCHTRRHERPASDSVALTQSCQVVGSGGGGGGGDFDDTSHQRRNYDKVSTGRCQIAQRLHQWTQRQMRQHDSQTRLAPSQQQKQQQQQQQQQQCLYASSLACNQSSRRCNDSNWQDLSPVVARLSAKATTATATTTMLQRWHTSSGSARNGRINVLSTLAAILFMALAFNATPLVDAGACWRSSQSNGKCSEIYLRNSTKAECCRYPELFYTDRDVTDVEFFFTTTVGDGMTCSPCALSCKSMQCGWNKKCVKRKGRPKCVCAPECGAAKRHKQRGQPKIYRGHEPHSEQLRMNRHIVAGTFGAGGGGKEAVEGDSASAFFNEGKSPRDIRSLSSEITNVNLGVEHQMQMQMQIQNQNQNQRKLIIMQSQSQQKPQLSRRVEKPGRLLITANVEHDTEKPVQQRIQIISNVRMNSRKHHNHFNRDNFDDEFNDDDDNNEDDEDNDEDVAADADAEAHNEDNNDDDDDDDLGDWLDDVVVGEEESTGNHRRSSDDSTRTPLESRRSFNLPSRHKANKNSNHNKKRRRHENEMELGKRQQENSNNNNFAIIKRFQLAATAAGAAAAQPSSSASNARRLENAPNHEEVLLPAGDTVNVNSASNGNNNNNNNYNGNRGKGKPNVDGGRQQRERHHHQQRKRKHQKQQQQHQHQQQQQHGHQHNHRAHKKHKKLKDHNANNNDNNARTRTSASATSSSGAQHTDNIATTITPIISTTTTTTMDWQTTAATTPVNSMSPSDDRRLLNHGSYIAKSSPSSPMKKQKTGASSEPFFGAGVDAVGVGVIDGGVAADIGKSSLNSDDSTLLDGIYEDFNVYGFPNRQFEVAVENFHGPHPVCGTDGRTYNTECQLKKRGCRTNNPALAVAYRGHCRTSCNGVKCLNGQTCVEDQYTIPHCIACKIDCPEDDAAAIAALPIDPTRAVCGVDGKTYRSVCDINRMICKSGRSVAVAYPGPCRDDRPTCSEINCGRKHTCLVDLLTLEPRCVSCSYKCARKRRPTSLRFEEGKICGVNNRTYNSWCELRRDSCNTGFLIDVKAPGECH